MARTRANKTASGFSILFDRLLLCAAEDFAERSDKAVTIGGIKLQSQGGGNVISSVRCRLAHRIWLDVGKEPVKSVVHIPSSHSVSVSVIMRNNFAPVRCNQLIINCAQADINFFDMWSKRSLGYTAINACLLTVIALPKQWNPYKLQAIHYESRCTE